MSPEQYLEIDRAADGRSEYLNGEMFAMSGATFRHNNVVNNIAAALRGQLKGRCRYATTDLRLFIPATGLYTYPDLMVICGEVQYAGDRQDIVTNPGFIAEVLSKSTADYDRGGKFVHYRFHTATNRLHDRGAEFFAGRALVAADGWFVAPAGVLADRGYSAG